MRALQEFLRDCALAGGGLIMLALCLMVAVVYRIGAGEWPMINFPFEDRED